jgi:hypothetical protein
LPWQQAETHHKFYNSQYPHTKMLNFGEHGHHNISHNFGIQRMRRFGRSIARKTLFPTFWPDA